MTEEMTVSSEIGTVLVPDLIDQAETLLDLPNFRVKLAHDIFWPVCDNDQLELTRFSCASNQNMKWKCKIIWHNGQDLVENSEDLVSRKFFIHIQSKCGNLIFHLPLRFYVKTIFCIQKFRNCTFLNFRDTEFWLFVNSCIPTYRAEIAKNQISGYLK